MCTRERDGLVREFSSVSRQEIMLAAIDVGQHDVTRQQSRVAELLGHCIGRAAALDAAIEVAGLAPHVALQGEQATALRTRLVANGAQPALHEGQPGHGVQGPGQLVRAFGADRGDEVGLAGRLEQRQRGIPVGCGGVPATERSQGHAPFEQDQPTLLRCGVLDHLQSAAEQAHRLVGGRGRQGLLPGPDEELERRRRLGRKARAEVVLRDLGGLLARARIECLHALRQLQVQALAARLRYRVEQGVTHQGV